MEINHRSNNIKSACIVPALLAGSFSFSALAETSPQTFKIPAQPLDDALTELADHAGMRLLYQADTVKNLHSHPVSGRFSPEQALQILLSDSGLNYRKTADNAITVEKLSAAPNANEIDAAVTLGTVKVTATAEDDINSDSPYNTRYNRTNATTATKTDTPIMQTPVSVKVVPQQVLKDQQVITVDQALRNVSGVVSGAGGTGTFFIRGFGSYKIYRDGFLNGGEWAHTEDLENIERVEVLKGPGSLLYGRTEPGGLVNFVTKQPLDTPYYSLRQQFGSFDHYRTSIDATGPITAYKDLGYRFNLGYQTNRTFQEFGGNERLLVAPTLRWRISDQTTSTLKVEYSDIQVKGNGRVPLLGNRPANLPRSRNLGDPWNIQEDEYVMLSLNTEHHFNDDWKLRHRFNFQNYNLTMAANGGTTVDPATGNVGRAFLPKTLMARIISTTFLTRWS